MKHCDVVVIGSGPAGQKAAIQAAKAGRRVILVEREAAVGGGCVHRGTIPSKTLREAALNLAGARRVIRGAKLELGDDFAISNLMTRLASVVSMHETFWSDQLERNGVELVRGVAAFRDRETIEAAVGRDAQLIRFGGAIIATGSRPRRPAMAEIDHEVVYDSDSILGLEKLPASLIVLGAGVIAAEYASIFACLGVDVTMIDNRSRPVPFLDPELSSRFVTAFQDAGGTYLPEREIVSIRREHGSAMVRLGGTKPETIQGRAAMVALGRVPNSDGLGLEVVGISTCKRGNIIVDEYGFTGVDAIYAIGDVIGPPSLASTSMDQGRRAARHLTGLPSCNAPEIVPAGVYTIPAISCIGISESQARETFGDAIVGKADYAEIARGCISGDTSGLVKMVFEPECHRLVGVHIIGTGAADLIHIGQVALIARWCIDDFIDNVFNFPTFAEGYRIAALDAAKHSKIACQKEDEVVRLRRASAMSGMFKTA